MFTLQVNSGFSDKFIGYQAYSHIHKISHFRSIVYFEMEQSRKVYNNSGFEFFIHENQTGKFV